MRIELKAVKKNYDGKEALNIETLEFKSGRIYALLGPNGAGKTTLLKIISGVEKPDAGRVYFDGMGRIKDGSMSYLPQKPYLFDMSAIDNVCIGLEKNDSAFTKAGKALEYLGMDEFKNSKMLCLSGGEAQRVVVSRTLVLEKSLVLLDEPLSSVDIPSMQLVENYIKMVNERDNSTIIFATHSPSQASRIADEALFMLDGQVIEQGNPLSMLNFPKKKETADFLKNWRI